MAEKNNKPNSSVPGVIEPGHFYRRDEFLLRLGLAEAAWRTMKSKGMPVTELCGRKYVAADDFLTWVKTEDSR